MTGIVVLIMGFFLIYYFLRKIKKSKRKEKCETCGGSGKIWDVVDDSHDLQTINCSYCKGGGKIQLNTAANKKHNKPTRPWRAKLPWTDKL